MNKWKPWELLKVLIIWIAFSVIFGLLSGVCFITIKESISESISVREQKVKVEQTESPVLAVLPPSKETRTIVFEEDDIAFCYDIEEYGRWEGKVFVDSIEFLSDSLYKVHGTRYCFEMDKFIEYTNYLSSLDLKPYYFEGNVGEETLKTAKESWRNSILCENEQMYIDWQNRKQAEEERNRKQTESSDDSDGFVIADFNPQYYDNTRQPTSHLR